jgi:mannose-6-phosphate isomerase-like protein (cupin superfamily)
MKKIETAGRKKLFQPLYRSAAMQAATMTLKPGQSSSDEKENEHPGAEQWLLVTSGRGVARVGKRSVRLKTGTLLLIEKREPHQITNTGNALLFSVNFYVPPAYTPEADVLRSASRR